ncbi:MAG: hypothetical protein NC543_09345 [bacterium]|nr:hypothetical protein [bacterium]MCM1375697.1 hypothetical protein [Muribaculum sp.]
MVNIDEMPQEMIASLAFSDDEKAALAAAGTRQIIFDEDCPETTPEQAVKYRRVNPPRNKIGKRA